MGYRLRDGLSVCLIDDQCVFLDLIRDRYFALDAERNRDFLDLLRGAADLAGDLLAELLVVTPGEERPAPTSLPHLPARSLLDEPAPALRWQDRAAALARLLRAILALRLCPLARLVDPSPAGRPVLRVARQTINEMRLARLAWAFQSAGRYVSLVDRCLARSLALTRTLRRHAEPAMLVFGVTLNPFTAHCWVQSGDLVLSDGLDHVRNFTPILVLE